MTLDNAQPYGEHAVHHAIGGQVQELLAGDADPMQVLSALEGAARAMQAKLAAFPAPPAQTPKLSFDLTGEAARLLVGLLTTDDDGDGTAVITLNVGEGHSGFGLYAWFTEYPEEGAELIATA